MPRAIWSGAISFGLVTIPVKLYPAVSRKSVRFNQLDARTGSRVKQKRVSAADGEEVPYEEIVKGYEISKDSYVVVSDDELATLMPKASRTIDISDFVEQADIDPVFYESGYHLVPDEIGRKSYALLAEAMQEADRVGIATFVMRTKQYLAAIRPVDGHLMLSTMNYADEIVPAEQLPGIDTLDEIEVSDAERAMAAQLIESLAADFEPERYEDRFREAVLDLIQQKAAGEVTMAPLPSAADDEAVVDLLAALEASVAAAKEARSRHPSAGDAEPKAKRSKKAAADVARSA